MAGSRSPAIDKALNVLELLGVETSGLRMINIARALGMPKSSTFLVLEALRDRGYGEQNSTGAYPWGTRTRSGSPAEVVAG